MTDKLLTVPFYSQYMDIHDPHWMVRGCGLTCLKMSLDYFGAKTPDLDEMIKKAVAMGAYGDSGWYHDGLITVAKEYGIDAWRKEDMDTAHGMKEMHDILAQGGLVLVSVVQRLLGRHKFHQVLLVGYREDAKNGFLGFYYHDPASTDREQGKALYVEADVFKVYWRNKAIF